MRMLHVRTQLDRFSLSRMSFKRGHINLSYTYADFLQEGVESICGKKENVIGVGEKPCSGSAHSLSCWPVGMWYILCFRCIGDRSESQCTKWIKEAGNCKCASLFSINKLYITRKRYANILFYQEFLLGSNHGVVRSFAAWIIIVFVDDSRQLPPLPGSRDHLDAFRQTALWFEPLPNLWPPIR